jgi:molybdopterin-containing oxidoreductase family iron-sulfur binding subunit
MNDDLTAQLGSDGASPSQDANAQRGADGASSSLARETPFGTGKTYWRSLDHLAETAEFREWVGRRFPRSMRELLDGGIDRRRFLHLMAASIGLAGLNGCRRPESQALPYTRPPEEVVPGLPNYYATAMPRPGSASPILVESHEGRPTKIEGNPAHPDSGGASDSFAQASVLDLYDPDRASPVLRGGSASNWEAYDAWASEHFAAIRARKGKGLHVLCEDIASPSLDLLREHTRNIMPDSRWHAYEPIGKANVRDGAILAFGSPVETRARLEQANVVLAFDCDFLGVEEEGGRHLRGFAESRRLGSPADTMSRLYVAESRYSLTGGIADHRLRLASSQVLGYTIALARRVLDGSNADQAIVQALAESKLGREGAWQQAPAVGAGDDPWVDIVAADLKAHGRQALILAGRRQPSLVHAIVHAMNAALGSTGKTVEYRSDPSMANTGTLEELASAIGKGQVETLLILGGNPAYDAPADLEFGSLMKRVKSTIRLGLHADETSREATWHLPAAHYLESWGDARSSDGTIMPIQPLIEPLFGGRTGLEVVARLSAFETTVPYEIVRRAFRKVSGVALADFESAWRRFLHTGLLRGSAHPPIKPSLKWSAVASAITAAPPNTGPLSIDNLELVFDRDAKVDDGRFANNGWLQELPDPVSKLTWDNAALFSPKTARAFGLATGDVVRLELHGRAMEIAVFVLPGQADFSVAVPLGYGRTVTGRVGRAVGFNAYPLRTTSARDIAVGLKVIKTGRKYPLACTQDHFTMEARDLAREQKWTESRQQRAAHDTEPESADIVAHPSADGEHQWGMVVDLNTCVGCNACVVACQSENNIPIVGKDEVARGREMHWIRLDRYFSGGEDDPGLVHQPVACVHCENAPCEVVCPVNATVHSNEGLNLQVYSRCIGTRYCLNNCPYKVRRFNFYDYNERPLDQLRLGPLAERGMTESLKMQKNPDVTIRIRGVMEKCTYCVQRIERAKIGARVAAGASGQTAVADGTIVPACAQACPARAIVFGDLSDPKSQVSQLKAQPRNYSLLSELNTAPRTTYLARFRNPNPRMPDTAGGQA